MSIDPKALDILIAKDAIRELAMLYSRGVDRKDAALLRTLYARDATDTHGDTFDGSAEDFIKYLEGVFTHMRYGGHHICNHLISVEGDRGEGEVYALAYSMAPDGKGGWMEDLFAVRYIDRYQKEEGRWRFSKRTVTYDFHNRRPIPTPEGDILSPAKDASYATLSSRLFARGPRA